MTQDTQAKTITHEDYLKLTGLLVLAAEANRHLAAINRAAAQITGEAEDTTDYFGCTSDEIYQPNPNADTLLRKLNIEAKSKEME